MPCSFTRYAIVLSAVLVAFTTTTTTQSAQQQPSQPRSVFKSHLNVVSVDVIVRDKSGAIVRGLTAADFEVREDGKPQDISNFSFEEVNDKARPALQSPDLLAGAEAKLAEESKRGAATATSSAPVAAARETPVALTSGMLGGAGRINPHITHT